jgi:hypothetical protein
MIPELQHLSPAPYVVGVTGHRDLRPQDLAALRHEVTGVLETIRKQAPGCPVVLLSGLAEGADQLVAEVALEVGVLLAAVLPMPLEIYRTTMPEPAQKRLDDLLLRANFTITLPLDGRTIDQIRDSDDAQAACYEELAVFLVRNSQALLALWDGKPSEKLGGTGRVVRHAVAETRHSASQCRVVYHVMTPRLSGKGPAAPVATTTLACEPRNSAGRTAI